MELQNLDPQLKDPIDFIGRIVHWMSGQVDCKGIIKDVSDDLLMLTVICADIKGQPSSTIVKIPFSVICNIYV